MNEICCLKWCQELFELENDQVDQELQFIIFLHSTHHQLALVHGSDGRGVLSPSGSQQVQVSSELAVLRLQETDLQWILNKRL